MTAEIDDRIRENLRSLADSILSEPPLHQSFATRPRRRRLVVGAFVGIVAVGGGAGLAVSLTQHTPAGTSAIPDGTPAPSIDPDFPVNDAGQTFGDPDPRVAFDDYPDLLMVAATNGKVGYIDRHLLDELTGANVSSPEEAIEWQRQQDAEGEREIFIPVYESDGTTVIGEFLISRSAPIPP